MHRIGIIQGRLVPQIGDRVQAFPADTWEDEFTIARELGYDGIELTIEMASWENHPVRSETGRAHQRTLAEKNGLSLMGLCCDVFMERPLGAADIGTCDQAWSMLDTLIEDGAAAGLPMIELPMMGENSLREDTPRAIFKDRITPALARAERVGIDILLECDLPASELHALMGDISHPCLGINYDMGNSTWFGFSPEDEIPAYSTFIRNVHVKDCTRADYSVPLGDGGTRFDSVFDLLQQAGYAGDFILQAARQEDDVSAARDYLAFTRKWVDRSFS